LRYVVDANVAVVANGRDTHVGLNEQLIAARFLREAMESGTVLDDMEDLALSEYRRHLNFSGRPTMGDEFFAWFARERWSGTLVERVPSPAGGSILSLLPPTLAGFDSDDHKWICIYLQGKADHIVNAVDSDWAAAASTLVAEGIHVLELLP